ncbi:PIN domain-containing protein [Neorhizobium huautlense]|uniref:PIN domain-containing protein n=1 Tax=Neorhizobium huautlense TaxID=67774 RepID=UPI0035948E57
MKWRQSSPAILRPQPISQIKWSSGDALHLAVATEFNAEIITLDKRFAAAAKTIGARCTLL